MHQRIWLNAHKTQRHVLFLASNYYANFQRENEDATAGYNVWRQVVAKVGSFVNTPASQSCVDTKISALEHGMVAILGIILLVA